MTKYPFLGFGLGCRTDYYEEILTKKPKVDWFEVISEDFLISGGNPLHYLEKIRQDYPIVAHGVSLSIGSADPLNFDYLKQLKDFYARFQPAWVSDHLCWTGVDGINIHDLLPLPYTAEVVKHIVSRVQQVQDYFGRRILLENVSSYITYADSEMTEWEFFNEIAQQADCLLLLDVNNIYVSGFNHGFES